MLIEKIRGTNHLPVSVVEFRFLAALWHSLVIRS